MKSNKKFKIVKPHFRKHLKKDKTSHGYKNHYAYIVGENKNEYAYNYLTHSEKSGYKKNKKLRKNPNKKDNKNAYIRKELDSDYKKNFSKMIKSMKLDPKDEKEIMKIIKRNKHFN